jgi:hypothetical protein
MKNSYYYFNCQALVASSSWPLVLAAMTLRYCTNRDRHVDPSRNGERSGANSYTVPLFYIRSVAKRNVGTAHSAPHLSGCFGITTQPDHLSLSLWTVHLKIGIVDLWLRGGDPTEMNVQRNMNLRLCDWRRSCLAHRVSMCETISVVT